MPKILVAPLLCILLLTAPARAADAGPSAAASQAFLAEHARLPGVTVRPSGLQVRILKSGMGRHFVPGDAVQIYYTAKLVNGMVIDGTSPGLPAPIDPGATLTGLGEALLTMREGDHWELTLPPGLAFGAKGGGGGKIGPDQALVFDVTMVASVPAARAEAVSRDGVSLAAGNGGTAAYWTIHP